MYIKPNNVKTIIVYTSDKPTPQLITINNNKMKIIYGPGDGVVPLNSLLVPKKWTQHNLEFIHLPNFEHSNIFFSDQLINIITPKMNAKFGLIKQLNIGNTGLKFYLDIYYKNDENYKGLIFNKRIL